MKHAYKLSALNDSNSSIAAPHADYKHPLFFTPHFLVLLLDIDGNIVDINPYGLQMLRYSIADLSSGIHISKLLPEHICEEWQKKTNQEMLNNWLGEISRSSLGASNTTLISKDGIDFDFDMSLVAQQDSDGQIQYYYLLGKEVSSYKRIEIDAKERDNKLMFQAIALQQLTSSDLLTSGDLDVTINLILEVMALTMDCDRASFWMFDESQTILNCTNFYIQSKDEHSFNKEILQSNCPRFFELAIKGDIVSIIDAKQDTRVSELKYGYINTLNIGATLMVPVRASGKIAGVLFLSHIGNSREWMINEQNFSVAISNFVTIALESHQIKQTLIERPNELTPQQNVQEKTSVNIDSKFIHTEKMASLGALIAGVAHEINTPIGAINAAGANLARSLPVLLQSLPKFFKQMTPEVEELFLRMVDRSVSFTGSLSSREERQFKKELSEVLNQYSIFNASGLAKELVKIGITDNVEEFLPIFNLENSEEYTQMAYDIGRLRVNIDNIGTAVAKTQKIVFALKSYSRRNSFDETEITSIVGGIETVLTIYHNQIKYGIELTTDFDRTLPPIRCYADELIQVWTNIIHNAIQAMEGKGSLHVSAKQENEDIIIRITDSGPGIPDNIVTRIFDAFFTTKPEGEGSGLGLDICRKIVEKHYGNIKVDTKPGETTFIVSLPVKSPLSEIKNNNQSPLNETNN